jgi:hypothetical protein
VFVAAGATIELPSSSTPPTTPTISAASTKPKMNHPRTPRRYQATRLSSGLQHSGEPGPSTPRRRRTSFARGLKDDAKDTGNDTDAHPTIRVDPEHLDLQGGCVTRLESDHGF